ncbi:MAG: FtsX-like permease family protein [Bacteroidota bacterium]|nr:FtsX-like permease family protein [Bacteroidota bacterium]
MIPSISWKNIWRNRVRSLVVITAITLGLFGGLFSSAIFKGMSERRFEEALSKEITHIQIHNPKYLENPEIGFTIPQPSELIDFIKSKESVKAVSSRLKITAMIGSSSSNYGVNVVGVDPEKEKEVSKLYTALLSPEEITKQYGIIDPTDLEQFQADSVGFYFENTRRNPMFIGEELAHKLRIKVRSKVVITFQNANGNLTGGAFRVCGIFRTENSVFEQTNVFVRQNDLIGLTGLEAESAHEIAIFLHDVEQAGELAALLSENYPNLETSDWKTLEPTLAMMTDMMDVTMTIIIVIILLALGFGIVNTMLMVVMERGKEIGMLMAVGMSKLRVFSMIILESVLLCLTGAAAGISISVLLIEIFSSKGIDMTAFAQEGFEAMGFAAVFYPTLGAEFYLEVTLLVVLTGVLSSVYPAWKALKLNPADALRSE